MNDFETLGAAIGADSMDLLGAIDPNILNALRNGRQFHPAASVVRDPAQLQRALLALKNRLHSSEVQHHPGLHKALSTQAVLARTIAQLEAHRRYEAKIKPTVVVGCNFDGVAAGSLSPVATIGTPYQGQDYAITGFLVFGQSANNFRLTQFNPGGVDLVNSTTSQAVKGTGATSPGVPVTIWAAEFLAKTHPRFSWAPWTGRSMVFSSEATFSLQVYNAGTSAGNCEIAIYMQCSPCGSNSKFKMMKAIRDSHVRGWRSSYFAGHNG